MLETKQSQKNETSTFINLSQWEIKQDSVLSTPYYVFCGIHTYEHKAARRRHVKTVNTIKKEA